MATSDSPKSIAATRTLQVAKAGAASQVLQYIFSDDFSSGDLSKTENGFTWGDGFRVDPSTDNPRSGTHSIKVTYQAEADRPDTDAFSERSFDLGSLYTTVAMEFDIYTPDGTEPWGGAKYLHRHDGGSNNNKLFRLWGSSSKTGAAPNNYSSREKVGASTWASYDGGFPVVTGESRARMELSGTGSGAIGGGGEDQYFPLYTAPYGEWVTIRFEMKMPTQVWPTASDTDGYMRVYKNGVFQKERLLANYEPEVGYDHAWQQGYIMGYANSGFLDETILFIDNFKVWGVLK